MINRRITRTLFNSTEVTAKTSTLSSDTLTLNLLTTDAFYIGYHGPFASRYFSVSTVNAVTSAMSASFWNGTAWVAVEDFQDQTSSGGKTLAQSGFISWVNPGGWTKRNLTGTDAALELYWIKLTISVALTSATAIQSCVNLFSDDQLLRSYYPELVSDSRYLPASRTDFLEQHEAAKNLCVQRLKQRHLIDDEAQVIDINPVAVAAVHATAWMIMNPIATSDSMKELAERAYKQFTDEIGSTTLDVDQNKDGVVSIAERQPTIGSIAVTRR